MFDASYLIQQDVLVHAGNVASGAIAFMRKLEEEGMPYVILTEQTGRMRDHIADYLVERGFRYVRPSNIYTSAMAAVDYLAMQKNPPKKVAYIGGAGIREVVEKAGYQITFEKPDVVFVGMNKKSTYADYSKLLGCLNDGAALVSTDNRRMQMHEGIMMLGNASIVKMLEYGSGIESMSFGRGSLHYLMMAKKYIRKENILFVGNDFTADIIPAMKLQMSTVFVAEGKSITESGMNDSLHSDYIVEDLFGLTK